MVFYVLSGDHSQAGPRKLRLGIPGVKTTLGKLRELLCNTHQINLQRYRLELQSLVTRDVLTDDSAEVKNYDEFRVLCNRKQLKDVMDDEAREAQQRMHEASARSEAEVMKRLLESTTSASPAATSSSTSGADNKLLARVSRVSALKLPLLLQPLPNSAATLQCALCELPVSSSVRTACCEYECCAECLEYAASLVRSAMCPLCGQTEKATDSQPAASCAAVMSSLRPQSTHLRASIKIEGAGPAAELEPTTTLCQSLHRIAQDPLLSNLESSLLAFYARGDS